MFKLLIEAIVVLDYRRTICFQVFVNSLHLQCQSIDAAWCIISSIREFFNRRNSLMCYGLLFQCASLIPLCINLHSITHTCWSYLQLILWPYTHSSLTLTPLKPELPCASISVTPLLPPLCSSSSSTQIFCHLSVLSQINSVQQQEQGTTSKEDYLQFKAGSKSMKLCYTADNDN